MPAKPSPPRVLLLAGRFEVRGSSRQTLNLLDSLPERGFEPSVLCLDARRVSSARSSNERITEMRALGWPLLGKLLRPLLLLDVLQDPPDLIHVQGVGMHAVGRWLARQTKRPYVLTVHADPDPRDSLRLHRTWGKAIVATTEPIRDAVLAGRRVDAGSVRLIRNGVSTGVRVDPILTQGRRPVVGTAGPLEAGKGLHHFLRAIPHILANGPGPTQPYGGPEFLIAGAGPEETSLRALARELGVAARVTFFSNLHDFAESLNAIDVFVLPSERPGMGVTMLEAMGMGIPVICTDIGRAGSEIRDGETGLLIPPADSDAIADRVTTLLRDPIKARRIGEAGQRLVRGRYPLANMLDDMAAVYHEALAAEPAIAGQVSA